MDEPLSFGYWVRRRRRALDLTSEQLAHQVGCAGVTIRKIETDERRPSRQIAERLATCLQIPEADRPAFLRAARAELAADRLATPPQPPLTPPVPRQRGERTPRQQALKGYELREQIGAGGFGAVYRALQPGIGREVAVKIILPEYADQPEFIRRFEAEAQLIVRLEHPHIVPLYDYWRESGGAYLVMRYVRGGSLQAVLHNGAWSLERCTRLLEQVGGALAFAHRHGVVHRDIKPANMLLDEEGNAYLADFGIAKDLTVAQALGETQPAAMVGSPAYLSPEQIRDEQITPQTDIYGLGLLLYEALTGAHPFAKLTPAEQLAKQLAEPLPPLHPDLPSALNQIVQRATAKAPSDRYPDVASLIEDWQHAVAIWARDPRSDDRIGRNALASAIDSVSSDLLTDLDLAALENPYKGLHAFGEADAPDFFGRTALTQRLLERLAEDGVASRFLAVVGPSGSGKSSVVRAGLIPALRRGGLPGSEGWFIVELLPGAHPLEEIEAALLRIAVNPPESLLGQLREDERGLARAVKRALPADEELELVLVVDQFEELFTLTEDETVRVHLLNSLRAAVLDPHSRLRVIITLRADFYDRPLLYAGFGELMQQRTEVVLPLTSDELEQAIGGPAALVGVVPAPELVAAIVKDVGEQPGTLPLLQYALTELFERRQGRALTLPAYRETGGVRGALARRAEEVYLALDLAAQEVARQLFLRLITLGEGVEDTRRRVLRAELVSLSGGHPPATNDQLPMAAGNPLTDGSSAMDRVIARYGRARLLSFDRDPITRRPTVEVAHEALLREWGRLRVWLEASRADVRMQRLLATAAVEWDASGREPSYLLGGARLTQFAGWAEQTGIALTQDERAYLDASVAEHVQREAAEWERQQRELEAARQLAATEQRRADEQSQAAARLRRRALFLAGALMLALIAAVAAGVFAQNARSNLTRSEQQRLAAQANLLLDNGSSGDLPALLAVRSLQIGYSPAADSALLSALERPFTRYQLIDHRGELYTAALSPDGKYALTGGGDDLARLSDVATGQELRQFQHGASSVAFSPDGAKVLTADQAASVWIWDLHTGQQLRELSGDGVTVNKAIFSPDGKSILIGSSDRTARLWNAQTGQEIRQFTGHTDSVNSVAFSPDGKYVVTGSNDKTARLWEATTGKQVGQFTGHTNAINSVAFSSDGRFVVTGSADKTARLWEVASGYQQLVFIGHSSAVTGVAISPDNNTLLTSGDFRGRIWDLRLDTEPRTFIGHTAEIPTAAFSPDGKQVLTGSWDGTARLWDVETRRTVQVFHVGGVWSAAFSPNGRQLMTIADQASLWDRMTGQLLHTMTPSSPNCEFSRVTFSPDSTVVFIGCFGGVGELYNVQTGQLIRTFTGKTGGSSGVAFAPDGKTVLTADFNGTISLWDVSTGMLIRALRGHTAIVSGAAFSPDGKFILSSGLDHTVRLWDVTTGQELRQFVGHIGALGGDVSFSHDGRYALTAGDDKTVRLWDVVSGQQLRQFPDNASMSNEIAFSPDGKYVLTGNADGSIARLWRVDLQEVLRFACAKLPRDLTAEEREIYSITDAGPTCPKQ
jgi:WD40 repeat protein/serine/threonine protein kinase/DNA-binding XRE family transcriptional regulator